MADKPTATISDRNTESQIGYTVTTTGSHKDQVTFYAFEDTSEKELFHLRDYDLDKLAEGVRSLNPAKIKSREQALDLLAKAAIDYATDATNHGADGTIIILSKDQRFDHLRNPLSQ